ncbi:hypothetical protein NP493_2157g00001 [Ridgeia piscesae]|uniref:Uncharacterized protein n=1 Tax=Ridgeia piscesae TaxID=27915 RepID=A0AAD9JKY5_RIDPI|nr:hypothetical protein NP493_2157g00001 [Ridgeia piscesae]
MCHLKKHVRIHTGQGINHTNVMSVVHSSHEIVI